MKPLYSKLYYTFPVTLLSGLHIGHSKEVVDIGGVDLPVVRRRDNYQPYIPGSSFKGKLRSLLDRAYGVNPEGNCQVGQYKEKGEGPEAIAELFGAGMGGSEKTGKPSMLYVADASLTAESAKKLENSPHLDMPYTEVKFENTIKRVEGTAQHPRQIERVPAGVEFEMQLFINIFAANGEEAQEVTKRLGGLLMQGLRLLQDDYLGKGGSRGNGRVNLHLKDPERFKREERIVQAYYLQTSS